MDFKNKIDIGEIDGGKVKNWIDIAKYYYQSVMLTITGYGTLSILGVKWYWLLIGTIIGIPTLIYVVYLHVTHIVPKELAYWHGKSPVFNEMLNLLKEILRRSK